MAKQRAKSKEQRVRKIAIRYQISNPPLPPFTKGGRGGINEKGIALVIILVLSAIALAIMVGLIYMITTGTQISGMQKKYKTAQEAGLGGADVAYEFIGLRGDAPKTCALLSELSAISPAIKTPTLCTGTNIGGVTFSGLAAKLNTPSTSWSSACDKDSFVINPSLSCTSAICPNLTGTSSSCTYDMSFDFTAGMYSTYRVYAKIVDTVEGNSGPSEGLLGAGVVTAGSGEVTVVSKPYLYTIEVNAENLSTPSERAKYSILYQY
ncbi:MAG: hypothetical protein AB1480_11970 [Nitrospirota bacterium]